MVLSCVGFFHATRLGAQDAGAVEETVENPDAAADARARRHFEAGTAYFQVGDYDSALRELRVAYEISHRPALLFNLYMTHERLGQFDEAAASLERFLREAPESEDRAALEQRLSRLRDRALQSRATQAPPTPEAAIVEPSSDEGPGTAVVLTSPTPSREPVITATGFGVAGLGLAVFAIAGSLVLAEDATLRECRPICAPDRAAVLDAATIVADVGLALSLLGVIVGVVGLVLETGGSVRDSVSLDVDGLRVRF